MTRQCLFLALIAAGCNQENTINTLSRVLTTDYATFDAGVVAVNDRQTLEVPLLSLGTGPVTAYSISLEDPDDENWVILNSWKNNDYDQDGENDSLVLEAGSKTNPTYGLVEVNFRPKEQGYFHNTLIIKSNDTEVVEKETDEENRTVSIWRVVLRGVARYPCGTVYPTFHDFGPRPAGGYYSAEATVENCGNVTLSVASYDVKGSASVYLDNVFTIYVLPGGTEDLTVAWIPSSAAPEDATVTLTTNALTFEDEIQVIGNNCEESVDTRWDKDEDGWFSCGGDCDDTDPDVNPSGPEDDDNGIDDDCDGDIDEGPGVNRDDDGDGMTENDGDCDDNDKAVYAGATEVAKNQIDDDCDGKIDEGSDWYDDDGDGFAERDGDCDDKDKLVYPGASEDSNEIDDDCDGDIDEGFYSFDDDEDGWAEIEAGGAEGDCDDNDPWTYPDATEDCDDRDNNCDGVIDEGEDGTPDGACSFLVDRVVATVDSGGGGGCSTLPGAAAPLGVGLSALAAALLRRRRR